MECYQMYAIFLTFITCSKKKAVRYIVLQSLQLYKNQQNICELQNDDIVVCLYNLIY
uniref:Uncharacterized protein n=1 Tax=Anguilla anguilla TaxID=7936 RepID=A0A0E9Q9S1_ANGAN